MSEKSAKQSEEAAGLEELGALLSELEHTFPVLVAEAAYSGPPAGLFREMDLVRLPPVARHTLTALGRLLWRQFRPLMAPEIGGKKMPMAPPLDVALAVLLAEFRYAAEWLAVARGAHRLGKTTSRGRLLNQLAGRSLRRLQSLGREIENQLPALRPMDEVKDVRKPS